jgi:penicillin-binding protein-related factor A (putative recombinase)
MAVNRGKKFEQVIRESFERVPGVSIDRLNDNTAGFKGIAGICDFIVYREPYEYYFECKSINRGTFPFSNITDTQWNGLLQKSQIKGVFAGIIVWFIKDEVTCFIPIQLLVELKNGGHKSINVKHVDNFVYELGGAFKLVGKKKRIFYEYDMVEFFTHFE